jgi:tritrans,polycis-undecaprenyl-diphosphate synthase [geranylgeranyl-diphosphate specific]
MLTCIGFIPDGNRRYAKEKGMSYIQSYLAGTKKAWEVVSWLADYPDISVAIFYTLSLKNLQRPQEELSVLFKIFENELDEIMHKKEIYENGIQIKFIGRKNVFPEKLQKKMFKVEEYTSQFHEKFIFLALGYDGQTEILDAAKKLALKYSIGELDIGKISVSDFNKYMYGDFKNPDLIIRTSKEQRLSGFLTYQSAYSELAFVEKYWPDLTREDLDKIIKDYESRDRRFGK